MCLSLHTLTYAIPALVYVYDIAVAFGGSCAYSFLLFESSWQRGGTCKMELSPALCSRSVLCSAPASSISFPLPC